MARKSVDDTATSAFDAYRCVVCGHSQDLHTPSDEGFAGFFHCGSKMAKVEPAPRPAGGARRGA